MPFFMNASANQIVPWIDVDIPYAYFDIYDARGNNTMTWDGASLQGVINFTLTPDAFDLRGATAQIEIYRLHFYSEQGPIMTRTYSIAVSGRVDDPDSPVGFNYAITGQYGEGVYMFIDGTVYDSKTVFGESISTSCLYNNMPDVPMQDYFPTFLGTYIADYDGEEAVQILSKLRNAQTLYIDVSRIGSVSYKGDSSSEKTLTTLVSNEVLCTVKFAKIDGGFVSGNYVEGSIPSPMRTPGQEDSYASKNWLGTDVLPTFPLGKTPSLVP
jgi:hypothetical protein